MDTLRFDEAQYISAYDILCASMPGNSSRAGIYPTFCRIPSQGKTLKHSHFEAETFYVIEGTGRMTIGAETQTVCGGDLVRIPPSKEHELLNLGSNELVFLSVYSEDFEVSGLPARAIVTAAPPTPNGPLHLGHMSGPYLASDILSRYLRSQGGHVVSHSGTDDHQNYVGERARSFHQSSEVFRKSMRSRIVEGLQSFQISFDEFIEPRHDVEYQKRIGAFAERAIQSGVIERELLSLPFCEDCAHFLVDALNDGICPHCEQPSRGGCESCGLVVPPQELSRPRCGSCGGLAEKKEAEAYTFLLSQYLPLIQQDLEKLTLSPRLRELVRKVTQKKDVKVLLTYPSPVQDGEGLQLAETGQRIHVWFEMTAHYERFALSDETWIHCFGFDNAFYYLLFIPALLRAMDSRAKLPDHVITNEFLLLDGSKFSTSRGHAIWADEVKEESDLLRLFLCLNRPDRTPSDFSRLKAQAFIPEMRGMLDHLNGRAQKVVGNMRQVDEGTLVLCNRFTREMELYYSPKTFNLRRASRLLIDFIDMIQQAEGNESNEMLMLRVFATTAAPILPNESKKLFVTLGIDGDQNRWISDWTRVL